MFKLIKDSAIIVLAFPDAYVSTVVNAWYNRMLEMSGISQFGKVCAGHAAMVLVNKNTGKLYYGDFGRYITAPGLGRCRMEKTDPEVVLDIKANFDKNGQLVNLVDILLYLEKYPEKTHGEGRMFATLSNHINFDLAYHFMDELNNKGGLPYGPFVYKGSNCSRFVADAIKASTTIKKIKTRFSNPLELTTSPLGNIAKGKMSDEPVWLVYNGVASLFKGNIFKETRKCLLGKSEIQTLKLPVSKVGTEVEPHRGKVPSQAQWLGGIGAGAWFTLDKYPDIQGREFRIRRFDPDESLIFDRIFTCEDVSFDASRPHQFVYDSNAYWCSIMQNGRLYRFTFKH